MRWYVPLFLSLFVLLSPSALWSQSPSSSRVMTITVEQWTMLNELPDKYDKLLTSHLLTVKTGSEWQKKMDQELTKWKDDFDQLLKDLEKERGFSATLLGRLTSLYEQLAILDESLEKAESIVKRLEFENTCLWVGVGVTTTAVIVLVIINAQK